MKAFFFDRDGTLNIDPGYINDPDEMVLINEASDILKQIKSLGYKIFVISNQSGIGRGKIGPHEYRDVNSKFLSLAGGYDVIDDILYCPHTPDHECVCRKPGTLFIDIIKDHHDIDCSKSYFVGDKITDIVCGKMAGFKTILILGGRDMEDIYRNEDKEIIPDETIDSVAELMDVI